MAATRTETRTVGVEKETGAVRRRGLIAAAAALVAGLAAKGMSESTPVAAADGSFIVIGAGLYSGTVVTALSSNNATDTLRIINFGTGAGLHGLAGSGIGVFGESDTGPAVRGVSGANGAEDGVRGIANGTGRGVSGFAGSGIGVQGNASGTGKGVEGLSTSGIAVNGSPWTAARPPTGSRPRSRRHLPSPSPGAAWSARPRCVGAGMAARAGPERPAAARPGEHAPRQLLHAARLHRRAHLANPGQGERPQPWHG